MPHIPYRSYFFNGICSRIIQNATDIELAVLNEAADVTGLSRSEYMRKLLLLSLYIFIPTVLRYVQSLGNHRTHMFISNRIKYSFPFANS
ncbi:hypothetical protein DXC04_04475 [Dorea sp. OM07-5]|nr:hypothetical protein DW125_07405 [Dorea sp. AM10-31]RHU97602.1 hypothetical protein DXC04_04475 [Dorea sp. OM07-5]